LRREKMTSAAAIKQVSTDPDGIMASQPSDVQVTRLRSDRSTMSGTPPYWQVL
jgi:hypothetical protein